MGIIISSSAFQEGEAIPPRYSCDGDGVSPPLTWSGVPEGAKSLALICDDPDAPMGTFVHWVLYNIPPATQSLPEHVPPQPGVKGVGEQGVNGARKHGYIGPCPPGGTHRYYFHLYALDTSLELSGEVTAKKAQQAMHGHILAEGQLMGRYTRMKH